jgi:hypothetical protein
MLMPEQWICSMKGGWKQDLPPTERDKHGVYAGVALLA